ncbi:MAG: YbhB/YbcL family Raf kinase inhibitor-like protein [Bacteroidia bacterium]|nr:YbhB/YbcL family Raf kinase inhibitor-like protein [Bacteroidia bacterium]MCX7651700.1 YbhB/YbcL family Raf kinase inhibitor-like protein [Bacteroidia bacterium]
MSLLGLMWWLQMWVKIGDLPPGSPIGVEHTCDGANIPPTIQWGGAPAPSQVYVLRLYDPDAPGDTFIHWIVYNLRETQVTAQSQNLSQGYNDFGQIGYGGPCPPKKDEAHRYIAEVYALAKPLSLSGTVTWEKLRAAMTGKILAQGQTYVTYKRQKR